MLYPTAGRPAPPRPKVTVTLATGEMVSGPLASYTKSIVVGEAGTDKADTRKSYDKTAVKYKIDNPMSATSISSENTPMRTCTMCTLI